MLPCAAFELSKSLTPMHSAELATKPLTFSLHGFWSVVPWLMVVGAAITVLFIYLEVREIAKTKERRRMARRKERLN